MTQAFGSSAGRHGGDRGRAPGQGSRQQPPVLCTCGCRWAEPADRSRPRCAARRRIAAARGGRALVQVPVPQGQDTARRQCDRPWGGATAEDLPGHARERDAGEGKTFTAMNLSVSINSEEDLSVLGADPHVSRPQLSCLFGLRNERGLLDVRCDSQLDVESVIRRTDVPSLSFLSAGKSAADALAFLARRRMKEVARRLGAKDGRRIDLLNTSFIQTAESPALVHLAGLLHMVVLADSTPQPVLLDALESLHDHPTVSLVLTQSKRSATSAHCYDGYGEERSHRSTGSQSKASPGRIHDRWPVRVELAHRPLTDRDPRPLACGGRNLPAERRCTGCNLTRHLRRFLHSRPPRLARFALAHCAHSRAFQGTAAPPCRLDPDPSDYAELSMTVGVARRHSGPPRLAVAGAWADCADGCLALAYRVEACFRSPCCS